LGTIPSKDLRQDYLAPHRALALGAGVTALLAERPPRKDLRYWLLTDRKTGNGERQPRWRVWE
jgi:hypothetical protein